MIKAIVYYQVKSKSTFSKKSIPYVYGSGQHYPELGVKAKWLDNENVKVVINARSVSQLVNAAVGMLRFSPNSYLKNIKITKFNCKINHSKLFKANSAISGAILKPALADVKSHYRIIRLALDLGFEFIKDDDVVEFSNDRVKKIYRFCSKKIIYFHKIKNQKQFTNRPAMIIPWIDGWSLAESFSKDRRAPLIIHCANTPLQISWVAHIILSRLVGADLIIVPDEKFDKSANFKEMIEASSRKIKNLLPVRIIIAGAITPKRVQEIKKSIHKEFHKFIGFTIGSWLIKYLK